MPESGVTGGNLRPSGRRGSQCARMRLGTEPAVPHLAVDNRLTAAEPLATQIAALAKQA